MHAPTKRSFSLAFLLGLSLTAGPAVAGQGNPGAGDHETGVTAREAPASGEPLPDQVGRELARLDERLDLGTFPDGSPLWPARLAASIERMTGAGAQAVPGRELLVSLATDLRALGVDQPLIGPPQAEPPAEDGPAAQRRSARLRHLLATARLLNRKLNRASSAADHVATRSSPANDDCASATSIGSGTFTGNTSGATNDGSATCGSSSSSPDVWYRYTATADGPVTFDTYGSTYDTVLSLRSACPGSGTELACSDDAGGTVQSAVTLDMTTGEEVWVRVSGFGGDAGSYVLHVAETGGISGTVTRQDTAAALSGVTVGVYDPNGFYVTEAQTSMDGTYKVDGLVPGTYYAEASVDNFVDEIYDGVPCPSYAYCYPGYNGTPLSVSSVVTGDIDFAVAPGASISGSLVDQGTGDPLQGFVYLYGATGGGYLTSVTTDGNGDYELTGLLPGKYYVKAQASGHQTEIYDDLPCPSSCDVTAGTQLQVTIGASVSGIDFALERLGNLEGTVSDQQTSAPVHSLRLYLYDSQGSFRSYTYSGSDGTYEFEGLLPGTYFLSTGSQYSDKAYLDELYDDLACATGCTVTTGTPISVPLAGTTSGIDFSLVRRGRISGAVTEAGSGAPLGNTRVDFYDASGYLVDYDYSSSDGSYLSPGLLSGTYFVVTHASSSHQNEVYDDMPCTSSCDPTVGTPIELTPETTISGIDFALYRQGVIEGTVTARDTAAPLFALVYALDSSGHSVGYDYTNSGLFEIPNLPPGNYYLKAIYHDSPDVYEDALYPDLPCEPSCDLSEGTLVSVSLGTTVAGVNFALNRCSLDSYTDLAGVEILGDYTAEACERASASSTTVHSGASLVLRAGREVILGDGFVVQSGASFRAVVDPSIVQP